MTKRIELQISVVLQSDAIFGSGYSIPGGEDISVRCDDEGYPCMNGSTVKGILRESLVNWLTWTRGNDPSAEKDVAAMFGTAGRDGAATERRVTFTGLALQNRPALPEDCFCFRTFTSLENGLTKDGTLRTARCITRGLTFTGYLECLESDEPLLRDAVRSVKWLGSMRNRGLGEVSCSAERRSAGNNTFAVKEGNILRYRICNDTPIIFTDLSRSFSSTFSTKNHIPGSSIRGMVLGSLAQYCPEWFEINKAALLSDHTRFCDALPCGPVGSTPIPTPMGFYEKASEEKLISVVRGEDPAGSKRAKLGRFCKIEGNELLCWSAGTESAVQILKGDKDLSKDSEMFLTSRLSAEQSFEGYIAFDDPTFAPKLAEVFSRTIWIGADRYAGCGRCHTVLLENTGIPERSRRYGYAESGKPGEELYMLLLSPLCMCGENGEPCGINVKKLSEALHTESAEVTLCSTSVEESGGFNRTWKTNVSALTVYAPGSLFRIRCSSAPTAADLESVEKQGLGMRRAEGFGQVLFLRNELVEQISCAATAAERKDKADNDAKELRRKKYEWIMQNKSQVQKGVSKSQIGSIQSICEGALSRGEDADALLEHLEHNLQNRGAENRDRYKPIYKFIENFLTADLYQTLGVSAPAVPRENQKAEKLRLLCMLFDFSRKTGEK